MSENTSEREKGLRLIYEKAHEIAKEFNIEITIKDTYDFDKEICKLTITSSGKSSEGNFSEQEVEDFPGKVGTENTIKKLRKMISALRR
jgi:hypothetical protein